MDKRQGKNSKTARKNMRKKLLESGTKVDESKVSRLSSEYTLMSEKLIKGNGEKAKSKVLKKNILKQKVSGADVIGIDQLDAECEAEKSVERNREKKKRKFSQKKREKREVSGHDVAVVDLLDAEVEDGSEKPKSEKSVERNREKKKRKLSQKKREKWEVSEHDVAVVDLLDAEVEDGSEKPKCRSSAMELIQSEISRTKNSARLQKADLPLNKRTNKSKRSSKMKKEDNISSGKAGEVIKEEIESGASDVYHIISVDADSSKGMKKWIKEYYQHRPGLKILQQRIDEFITSREENEEQARKEKEALAAEGGWTVVVHQKGRKKTTDAESGTVVGSVAQAAVVGHMSQKKIKDFGVDFYRFQKREAQRNEIMVLQSKFEEDKKRIQQLRSTRKFRPY